MKTLVVLLSLALAGVSRVVSQADSTPHDSLVVGPGELDSVPRMLAHPKVDFPVSLYTSDVSVRVMVQAIIDTTGHPELSSVVVVKGVQSEIDSEAVALVRRSVFSPGKLGARRVRVLVQVPVSFVVAEKPERISGPPPVYPAFLQQMGVEGVVRVSAILDTTGHVEPGSVHAVSSTHGGFERSAIEMVTLSVFKPARVGGRPVRVLVQLPVTYIIRH